MSPGIEHVARFVDRLHAKDNLTQGTIKLSKVINVMLCGAVLTRANQFAANPVKVATTLRDCFGFEINDGKPKYVLNAFVDVLDAAL